MIKFKKIYFVFLLFSSNSGSAQIPADTTEMNIDAKSWTQSINLGWNLGNSLESTGGDETAWGNPKTTKNMISALKDQGFNAIRIPVQWGCHVTDINTMTIDPVWMNRVQEVVNYCIDLNMKVILNTHHEKWLEENPTYIQQKINNKKLSLLWTQIATRFRNYNYQLAFAGINEVQVNWQYPTAENADVENSYNQTFIDAVRATGGRNVYRNLIIQTYSCNPDYGFKTFTIPKDPTKNRLSVEFHYYNPYNYCSGEPDCYYYWGTTYQTKGEIAPEGEIKLQQTFEQAQRQWSTQGLGIVIGELGVSTHFTTDDKTTQLENEEYYLKCVVAEAKKEGFAPFVWDNNAFGNGKEKFGIFNRNNNMQINAPWLLRGLQEGAGITPYNESTENTTFWKGYSLLNWSKGLQLTIPATEFTNFTTKSKIFISITQVPTAEYDQLQIYKGDWSNQLNYNINSTNFNGSFSPRDYYNTTDKSYTLAVSFDDNTLAEIQATGLVLQGYGLYLTQVKIAPTDSTTIIRKFHYSKSKTYRIYDINGIKITIPRRNQIFIMNGKKYIMNFNKPSQ